MDQPLVPIEPQKQAIAVMPTLPEWMVKASQPAFNTLDMTMPNAVQMLSKVSIGCDVQLSEKLNEEIEIESWFAAPYEKEDPATNEIVQLVYLALVTPTGYIYGCSSIGVRRSLLLLSQEFGFKAWKPALRVKVRAVKAAVGKMFALEFVSRSPETKPQTKGK